ncbi:MAG: class I SAM-dependent methyltransferase [Burkholderiaceae bacterium]
MTTPDMSRYFSGEALYGDDLDRDGIAQWFADEEEGYANLGASNEKDYRYVYHQWNRLHGFSQLPAQGRFEHLLAFGSAYGEELVPVVDRTDAITVVDPSDAFVRSAIHGVPATYIKPGVTGQLPVADASFDMGTCLGVLHHIPNVSSVVAEIARTLKPGAYFLLREPVVSMGDWRKPRAGLTIHERGIPAPILKRICVEAGFEIVRAAPCGFALTPRLFGPLVGEVYNSGVATRLDSWLSRLFAWNSSYHATSVLAKLRPTSLFLVLRRRG